MKKTKKQTPQQVFNQFLFDSMMTKIRDAELLEEKVTAHENLLKVHVQKIGDFGRLFAAREERINHIEAENHSLLNGNYSRRIEALEKEIKDQREDYHAHIRQLVEENKAAHQILIASIETLQTQASNLESQIAALTNELLKLRDAAKKKSGRPKTVKK